jgi:hypothetical protein
MKLNLIPVTHSDCPEGAINITGGVEKFGGSEKQFKSMLVTFDQVSVDGGLAAVY